MIDQDAACGHSRKYPLFLDSDLSDVVIITYADQYQVGSLGRFGRGGVVAAAIFIAPCLGFGCGAVVDAYIKPGSGQVSSHGVAHDPKADKGGSRNLLWHCVFLCLSVIALYIR